MTRSRLAKAFADFKRGKRTAEEIITLVHDDMAEDLGFATIDHHREYRKGFPEVILCEGKTEHQVAEIARHIVKRGGVLLGTRATQGHFRTVRKHIRNARYNEMGRTICANEEKIVSRGEGTIVVVTAGTSDIPVAEEACDTARVMGNRVERIFDVGVAGIHRVLAQSEKLRRASVIIVVAGMEGALASVVGGLVDVPIIAVPTSVGYGASFRGVAALLGMLNSCAAGVTVVNIDNGFGAGFAASLMNRKRSR